MGPGGRIRPCTRLARFEIFLQAATPSARRAVVLSSWGRALGSLADPLRSPPRRHGLGQWQCYSNYATKECASFLDSVTDLQVAFKFVPVSQLLLVPEYRAHVWPQWHPHTSKGCAPTITVPDKQVTLTDVHQRRWEPQRTAGLVGAGPVAPGAWRRPLEYDGFPKLTFLGLPVSVIAPVHPGKRDRDRVQCNIAGQGIVDRGTGPPLLGPVHLPVGQGAGYPDTQLGHNSHQA